MSDPEKATTLCVEAAERVAAVLPASEDLTVAGAQPGTAHVVEPFAAAVVAETDDGRLGVLVAEELLAAVEGADVAGVDLAGAVRPALEAAAEHLGLTVQEVRTTELDLVLSDLGGDVVVAPLVGDGFVAALAVPRPVLQDVLDRRAPESRGTAPTGPTAADEPQGFSGASPATAEEPASSNDATDQVGRTEPPLSRPVYHQGAPVPPAQRRGIELLHGVDMEVTVELGRTRLAVKDLLALSPGAVVELDRAAGAPADLLVNGKLIARGEVVVVDEDFGLRITEIVETKAAV